MAVRPKCEVDHYRRADLTADVPRSRPAAPAAERKFSHHVAIEVASGGVGTRIANGLVSTERLGGRSQDADRWSPSRLRSVALRRCGPERSQLPPNQVFRQDVAAMHPLLTVLHRPDAFIEDAKEVFSAASLAEEFKPDLPIHVMPMHLVEDFGD